MSIFSKDQFWPNEFNEKLIASPGGSGQLSAFKIKRTIIYLFSRPGPNVPYVHCINTELPNIWADQSVCTSLDKNNITRGVFLRSRNVREEGCLNFAF